MLIFNPFIFTIYYNYCYNISKAFIFLVDDLDLSYVYILIDLLSFVTFIFQIAISIYHSLPEDIKLKISLNKTRFFQYFVIVQEITARLD